jgi:hypothetical protein
MAWHIVFSKNSREAQKNLGKILVSKFLLNLLIEILKVLPNFKFYLNLKIKTLFIFLPLSAHPAQAAVPAHSFPGCHLPSSDSVGPLTLGVFLGICLPLGFVSSILDVFSLSPH